MEEDNVLLDIVRKYFPEIPNELFFDAPVEFWIEQLGFEKQIEIAEAVSQQRSKAEAEAQMQILSNTFMLVPLDVIAYMLKNTNNSSLLALCRVDKWFHTNCPKIIEKIGIARHGREFRTFLQNQKSRVSVEMLIAFEAAQLAMKCLSMSTQCRFQFSKDKNLVFDLQVVKRFWKGDEISGIVFPILKNGPLPMQLLSYHENLSFFGKWDSELSFFLVKKNVDEVSLQKFFMVMLTKYPLSLSKVIAYERGSFPSDQGEREIDTTRMTSPICCAVCKLTDVMKCGGNCTNTYYCSTKCQSNDWNNHKKKCTK